jgi:hypothetical protein
MFYSDSDPKPNSLTQKFFKTFPLIGFICALEPVRQKKGFQKEQNTFDLRFFAMIFKIVSLSKSVSELFFGYGFGQNTSTKVR